MYHVNTKYYTVILVYTPVCKEKVRVWNDLQICIDPYVYTLTYSR